MFEQFQKLDSTWIYHSITHQWSPGPPLLGKRNDHSCFYDQETHSVYVIGGVDGNGRKMNTSEVLKIDQDSWKSSTEFPGLLMWPAAVASNSIEFIGYLSGGIIDSRVTDEVWGLRRSDLKWVEMSKRLQNRNEFHSTIQKRLQIPRYKHTMVNIASNDLPEC